MWIWPEHILLRFHLFKHFIFSSVFSVFLALRIMWSNHVKDYVLNLNIADKCTVNYKSCKQNDDRSLTVPPKHTRRPLKQRALYSNFLMFCLQDEHWRHLFPQLILISILCTAFNTWYYRKRVWKVFLCSFLHLCLTFLRGVFILHHIIVVSTQAAGKVAVLFGER